MRTQSEHLGREAMNGDKQRPRVAGTGRLMRMKPGGWFWNDEIEEQFFDHLATNGNVRAAADAVGFCTPTVYRMRRRRPEFAARWQVALEQGYARLEMALLEAANDSLADRPFDESRPIPKMTVEQAMNVLRAHRNALAATGRGGPGRVARVRSIDEVRAEIEHKVRAIAAVEFGGKRGDADMAVRADPVEAHDRAASRTTRSGRTGGPAGRAKRGGEEAAGQEP